MSTGINCDCGAGVLVAARLASYDAGHVLGTPLVLHDVDGLRCSGCGYETIDGVAINAIIASHPDKTGRGR